MSQEKRKTTHVLKGLRGGGSTADGEIRCGFGKTMTLLGLGEVGVTGRDVGHVGGVIPGKGECALQGRETAECRVLVVMFCSEWPAPSCMLWGVQRCVCVCVYVRLRGAKLGKGCFRRHVDIGLHWGERRKIASCKVCHSRVGHVGDLT